MYIRTHVSEPQASSDHLCADSLYLGHLSGTTYHDFYEALPQLRPGQLLHMQREPDNPYDCYAISVHHGSHKLGWIPRSENQVIARLLDAGVPLELYVRSLSGHPAYFGGGLEVELFVARNNDPDQKRVISPKIRGVSKLKENEKE